MDREFAQRALRIFFLLGNSSDNTLVVVCGYCDDDIGCLERCLDVIAVRRPVLAFPGLERSVGVGRVDHFLGELVAVLDSTEGHATEQRQRQHYDHQQRVVNLYTVQH